VDGKQRAWETLNEFAPCYGCLAVIIWSSASTKNYTTDTILIGSTLQAIAVAWNCGRGHVFIIWHFFGVCN